ncbi:hypothetical protein [Haloarchaeobius baliensis]|uniref:hypothetical protein n=1 Tax=Haloarchaeobius baliensis TaxID=1670458 RepID=UPI003F881B5A
MKAVVLTEEAQTVSKAADDPQLLEYYKGQFRPVATLVDELTDIVETDVYILSDEHGLCEGRSTLSEVEEASKGEMRQDAQKLLRDAVPDADVVVVLLTKRAFMDVVEPIWDELVETTKSGAIWGLGLPRSALDSVDLDSLRTKNDLYVYRRSGVARLGTETRNQLLAAVEERSQG